MVRYGKYFPCHETLSALHIPHEELPPGFTDKNYYDYESQSKLVKVIPASKETKAPPPKKEVAPIEPSKKQPPTTPESNKKPTKDAKNWILNYVQNEYEEEEKAEEVRIHH